MIALSKTLQELVAEIVGTRTHSIAGHYPTEFQTFDEAWENLTQSLEHLRGKLGDARFEQLADMKDQARKHFEAGEAKWGARLMQDMEQVVRGKPPFAYPEEMYRWPRHAND